MRCWISTGPLDGEELLDGDESLDSEEPLDYEEACEDLQAWVARLAEAFAGQRIAGVPQFVVQASQPAVWHAAGKMPAPHKLRALLIRPAGTASG